MRKRNLRSITLKISGSRKFCLIYKTYLYTLCSSVVRVRAGVLSVVFAGAYAVAVSVAVPPPSPLPLPLALSSTLLGICTHQH
jgi:hypothetical protein